MRFFTNQLAIAAAHLVPREVSGRRESFGSVIE
jgi:hypothetical protein